MEVALWQDIGPDPSMEHNRVNYTVAEDHANPIPKYKMKFLDPDPLLTPDAYFAGLNWNAKKIEYLTDLMEDPPTFRNRPLSRGEMRRKFKRKIPKSEFHWRNVEMMT